MQHIEHLSQLLHDHVQVPSSRPLTQAAIDSFFQYIATDRIHLTRLDWQGHLVTTMLWHMPNLRPQKLTALVAYITHQWDTYTADGPASSANAAVFDDSPAPPSVTIDPVADESPVQTNNDAVRESINPQKHFLTTLSAPRRDWFDRFTDWVAAVISLFE